jgi:hypothetical protein
MKLQEKQRTNPTNIKVQHHHPGYIPTVLWQMFSEKERPNAGRRMYHDTGEKNKASRCGTLQFMPACFDCGGVIQPGDMNTTIRMVELNREVNGAAEDTNNETIVLSNAQPNLSRTQRRRESRFKAKLYRKEFYGSKQQQQQIANYKGLVHTTNNKLLQPHTKSRIWQYIWQQQNKYYHHQPTTTTSGSDLKRVYPFLNCCTHYFIVTCGSCGVQIFLPDFRDNNTKSLNVRNNKSYERMKQFPNNRSVALNRTSQTEMKNEKHQIHSPSSNNSGETISNKSDINQILNEGKNTTEAPVSLNSLKPQKTATTITLKNGPTIGVKKRKELDTTPPQVQLQSTYPATFHPTSTMKLHPQQKKKKSKNVQGKNDLMSFLSSLNDR